MGSYLNKIFFACLIVLISLSFAGAVSINTLSSPYDSEVVSPNSQVSQVVRLDDAEGNPINQSDLENNSNLDFTYFYDDNESSIIHMDGGYYYALFSTGSNAKDVEFQIIDNSVTGEINKTESLETGKLDVDILSSFSGSLEANQEITVKASVEDLTDYKYVDVDRSGNLNSGDIVLVDTGGDGTFTKNSDEVFAGKTPENSVPLSGNNPWSDDDNRISFNDSGGGDEWNPGEDLILLDYNGGGTVSTSADEALNTGIANTVNSLPGADLKPMSEIRSEVYFVSSDMSYNDGEATVFDNDSDEKFTKHPDLHVAGEIPPEGESVTHEDTMPEGWQISSYDASGSGEWDPSTDFLAIDNDNDSVYTARADIVLSRTAPPEAAELKNAGFDDWNDANPNVVSSGDLEVHDNISGNSWNDSEDAIWIESNDTLGYQPDEDQLIAPNSADRGLMPNKNSDIFAQWSTISAYDSGDTSSFNPSVDSVVKDFHSGGTYSKRPDSKIAGTIPTGFSDGTSYSKVDGFADSWELDVRRPVVTGGWSGSRDTIFKDRNEGGTYSTASDTVINAEGAVEAPSGTSLRKLNSVSSEHIKWVDVNGNGRYDRFESEFFGMDIGGGDEIFRDLDNDDLYTAQADKHLAGVSINVAGEGTPLRTFNSWKRDQKPVLFYDNISGDEWNSTQDSIIWDIDSDGVYSGQSDRIIQGTGSDANSGVSLSNTGLTDFNSPDLYARITSGTNTTPPVELGRKPNGNYTGALTVPEQFDTSFLLQVRAEGPVADTSGFASKSFTTRAKGIGFDAIESNIQFSVDKKGDYKRNVTLRNLLDQQNTINFSWSQSISNITSLADEDLSSTRVDIPSDGNTEVGFKFNLTSFRDYSGELIFEERGTEKQETVDVEINTPTCIQETSVLCIPGNNQVIVTADERETVERSIEVLNIAQETQQVQISTDGNISDYVSVNESVSLTDGRMIDVEFNPEDPGNFTGVMDLSADGETVSIDLALESNVKRLDSSFDLTPSEVNLGTVPEGEDQTSQIQVSNTGTVKIEKVNITSEDFNLEADSSAEISPSDSKNFTVTLKSLSSSSGEITVDVETSESNISRDVTISADTVKPVSEMKEDIRTKISNLRSKASSQETMSQLTNLQTKTSSIQSQWDQGKYGEAKNIYDSTTSTLSSIESNVQSNSGTQTGGGSNNPNQPQQPQNSQESGGGGGMIVVMILLLLILVAGFVVYTSYYPEEGDPLYDVLGDKEE